MRFKQSGRHEDGLSLLELMVIIGIMGFIIGIGVPNLMRARDTAQQRACTENLSRLEGFKQQWGAEKQKSEGDVPDMTDLQPYLKNAARCPSGGTYSLNALGSKATCSIAGHAL